MFSFRCLAPLSAFLLLFSVLPQPGHAASAAVDANHSVSVVDDAGQTLRLAHPAQRVISMAPHLTELLFTVGAGAQLVGAIDYSDYPPEALRIPRIGDALQLDLERIVSLHPELIVVWRHGNSPQQVARLRALGIPIYESEASDLPGIAGTLRRLGQLTGHDDQAERAARDFESALAELRRRHAGAAPLRVFYEIWDRPLMTINRHQLISQVLALCGASNVFADLPLLTPTVSAEDVVAADPDAIVTGGREAESRALALWRRLPTLRATRQGHLVQVDGDLLSRPSTRIVQGAAELCQKLDAVRATPGPAPR